MYAEQYRRMSEPLRRDPRAKSLVLHANSLLTAVGYIAYPLLVILLAATGSPLLVRAVAIPAAAFVAVSLLRRVLDAPRPYEKDGIDAIIYKDMDARGRKRALGREHLHGGRPRRRRRALPEGCYRRHRRRRHLRHCRILDSLAALRPHTEITSFYASFSHIHEVVSLRVTYI